MATWDEAVQIAAGWPGVQHTTWYRTPALKVAGRGFARLRTEADGTLVVMCSLDEKTALLATGDPAFSTTSHYDGHGAILLDLALVDLEQLREMLAEAWRSRAPRKLLDSFDPGGSDLSD
ncbi:MAG: MmcQ/YjbR family DNA-binding protein [Nakamurella sp.]